MPTSAVTAISSVRSGAIEGALRPRVIGLAGNLSGPSWFALLLETGRARFAGEANELQGPVLAWRPWSPQARVTLEAGSSGLYVTLGSTALSNAVGYMPETRDLRDMADIAIDADLDPGAESLASMRAAFGSLHRELGSQRTAAHAVVEAQLRVILVEVYRAARAQHVGTDRASPTHRAFAQFSALVEQHFRDRWTVQDYAATIGMSRDRLADISRRVRGLGPKELIDRRVAVEARRQLESSSSSLQQIADVLGFTSTPQFTRFFRRTTGMTPGRYRREVLKGAQGGMSAAGRSYEWP